MLASGVFPARPAVLSLEAALREHRPLWQSTRRGPLLCSIPDVCVLHWWKDPHLLCSPLGLINGVIYRLAD